MRTLIIPCCGGRQIDGRPQYLVRHPRGKLLLEKCMEGINPAQFDRILVTVLREDHAKETILSELGGTYPVEVVELAEQTNGPADTVYETVVQANVTGSLVVKDVDNFVAVQEVPEGNFVAGLDLNTWEHDVHNLRNKSFLIINEQKNILDVIEKQFRSDVICLGLYGFKSAERFCEAYRRLNTTDYPITRLYLSHIISYMIGYYDQVFRYVEASAYENWGDRQDWENAQSKYATYFVDLDQITDPEPLKALAKNGAVVIGFSASGKTAEDIPVVQASRSAVKQFIGNEEELKKIVGMLG